VFAIAVLQALTVFGATYTLSATRVNRGIPLFTHQSIFDYNFNPSFVPAGANLKEEGLFVRVQNNKTVSGSPYSVTPSNLVYSKLHEPIDFTNITFAPITSNSIAMAPSSKNDTCGVEDPRIVYREKDQLYYLFYTQWDCVTPRLALATAKDPRNSSSWTINGPIFAPTVESKSGSLLIRDDVPGSLHYLYWGDNGIYIATSPDLYNWTNNPNVFINMRSNSFDSGLVEGGPLPLRLSDGNYLMIYNSARHGVPSSKPGWDLQYNAGWVVLNYSNPTQILARSSDPLLSPQAQWEMEGFTPNVVFVEGWKQIDTDTFLIFYGGADQEVGAAVVKVKIS